MDCNGLDRILFSCKAELMSWSLSHLHKLFVSPINFIPCLNCCCNCMVQNFIKNFLHKVPMSGGSDFMLEKIAEKVLLCTTSCSSVIGNYHIIYNPIKKLTLIISL